MNKKQLIKSFGVLAFVGAVVVGGTGAFFSSTTSSTGNKFTAGSVALVIQNITHAYTGGGQGKDVPVFAAVNTTSGYSFTLDDIKPLDKGTITYELQNQDNPVHLCVMVDENTALSNTPNPPHKLADHLSFKFGTNTGLLGMIAGQWYSLGQLGAGPVTQTYTVDYCFGAFDSNGSCVLETIDYNPLQNSALGVDVNFYAVQTRNNSDFNCADLNIEVTTGEGWSPFAGDQVWFAKARNNNNNFEVAVGTDPNTSAGQNTAEATWQAGTDYNFTLSYDATTDTATWTAGPETTTFVVGGGHSNLGITAKAPNGVTTTVSNLALDIYPGLTPTSIVASNVNQHLSIGGLNLDQDWTLTGTFNFSAVGSPFSQEAIAVQVSVN